MELKQFGPLKIFFVREYRDHKPLKKTGNINFCKQNWNALVLIFARFFDVSQKWTGKYFVR